MTNLGAKVFLDTNVLLRATLDRVELHDEAQKLVETQRDAGKELWISRQVIREYMVYITRPQVFFTPMSIEEIEALIQKVQSLFQIADETAAVTAQLLRLIKQYPTGGKQIHDANIVATMLVNGIDTLLTQNIDDMKRFEKEITLIPLKADSKT
jgi:predicted nucleic acid-binding protein